MSHTRKRYFGRLIARIVILLICTILWICDPEAFTVLNGFEFFHHFSLLHILWLIWILDMLQQIIPIKNKLPLGSQKLFALRFRPLIDRINYQSLRRYIRTTTKAAYKVMIVWILFIALIGAVYYAGWIDRSALFMISVLFYVFDLVCVLIWCPFRLMMKTRCCTTCRIFNWDHFMMFSPLVFVGGFYAVSLVAFAVLAWAIWEICILIYPERFWEGSNIALRCSECTDKLCTQYCNKIR